MTLWKITAKGNWNWGKGKELVKGMFIEMTSATTAPPLGKTSNQEELSVSNECNEASDQCSYESCVASGDSVALVIFSDEAESLSFAGDSSLLQEADIIVRVVTKDGDDRTDGFCSTDSFHPDSVLVA